MSSESIKILRNAACWLVVLMAFTVISINASAAEYKEMESCWTAPTERESGAALDISEIRSFEIAYDYSGDGLADVWLPSITDTSVRCIKFTPSKENEVCFKGITIDTDGLQSKLSNKICKTPILVDIPVDDPPRSPTMLDVLISKVSDWFKDII